MGWDVDYTPKEDDYLLAECVGDYTPRRRTNMTEPDYKEWAEWILVEIYELDLTREQQKKRITEALEAIAMQKYWQGKREGREEYALERDIETARSLEDKRRKKVLQELEEHNDALEKYLQRMRSVYKLV